MLCQLPTENTVSTLAHLLKAAGDELRLNILQVLARDSYGVLELVKIFDVKQSGMSHHLKVLASVGLVVTRREGNSIFYRRTTLTPEDPLHNCKISIFTETDQLPRDPELQLQLKQIWADRAQASQNFFYENSMAFKQKQDLIANFEVYRQPVTELLNLTHPSQDHTVIEIGPGEGDFLETLSKQFKHVVALDSSAEMLALANQKAQALNLNNIQYFHGDTSLLVDFPETFDSAVINMVLHHTPSPALLFQDVGAALKPHASLIITELCTHNQAWTQDACGDVWLGFDPDDLTRWAVDAHFAEGQSTYFALRNGFQIQVRQFIKQQL